MALAAASMKERAVHLRAGAREHQTLFGINARPRPGARRRSASATRPASPESEAGQALGVGDDVHLHDPALRDREGQQ